MARGNLSCLWSQGCDFGNHSNMIRIVDPIMCTLKQLNIRLGLQHSISLLHREKKQKKERNLQVMQLQVKPPATNDKNRTTAMPQFKAYSHKQ